jgi:protein-tyrosine phosphatase
LLVIDIHCHILPGVDDGAKSWEIAVEMCRMAAADGITHMVATPHANDRYPYDRPQLQAKLDQLRDRIGNTPELSLGSDFHLSYESLQDLLNHPLRYTINGSRYLLVELSDFSIPTNLSDCFLRLGDLGVTAVITHPERNALLRQSPQRVLEWVELGCVVQVTANALTGFWGTGVARTAAWLLEREAVHVLASDAHDAQHRVPVLSRARDAVSQALGAEVAQAMVEANPRAILAGQPLPYLPRPAVRN